MRKRRNDVWRIAAYLMTILMVASAGTAYGSQANLLIDDAADLPAALQGAPTDAAEQLTEIAGPELTERLEDGQTTGFEVIATGTPHEGFTAAEVSDRATAMETLDQEAAPLFSTVENVIAPFGGSVTDTWSAAPAMKLAGDLDVLLQVALVDDIHHVEHEDDDAFHIIEPLPGDEMNAMNSEGRQMIQAEDIWGAGYEGDGITISVIDTGVDPSHEAFKFEDGTSRLAGWADCQSGGCDTSGESYDDHGHGTHVAGSAAGTALYDDPDHGVFEEVGVAPGADIYSVKFLGAGGGGSFDAAMDSLQWSFDNGADVTSNSWGGGCSSSASVVQLVNQLSDLGMPSVFAAGNSGSSSGTIGGPACADSAISVGAVDGDENIASFSSRGPCEDPTTDTGERTCPDVVAKGVDVRSAIPREDATNADPSGYKTWQGTSMATPMVAGAVALAEEMKEELTGSGWDTANDAEKEVLRMTAKGLPSEADKPNNDYGWGLVQLLPILAMLQDADEAIITDSFSVSKEQVRLGETVDMVFSVTNLGNAVAEGPLSATLEHPDGTQETVADTDASLGLLDSETADKSLTVEDDVLHGEYTFSASFEYEWEDPDTGEIIQDEIEREATFTVKRVLFDFGLDGLEDNTTLLTPQNVSFEATNVGNEDGQNVLVEVTFPDDYEFLPDETFDPTEPNSRYATPTPDIVAEDPRLEHITLIWEIDEVPQGDSFTFTSQPLPTSTGNFSVLEVVKYEDTLGTFGAQSHTQDQTVSLLPVP